MPVTRVTFPNLRGQTLAGILDKPDAPTGRRPAVVLCHGFTGFKEVKYLVRLAQALRDAGFVCLRFDYADGVGDSDGSCEDMLLTHQIEDTFAAVNFMEADPDVDGQRIGLAGHSMGGVACIAVAASDTRVKALMTIAAPAHPDLQHLFAAARAHGEPDMVKRWKRQGFADIPLYPKGHVRVRYNFLEDFRKYDATEIIRQVRVPALFVQGARDNVVPPRNAQALYDNAGGPRKLELVPGAEHLFLDNASIQHMVRAGVEWFNRCLAGASGP
ncbi:MAG: alpha/beta hydrolase [Chloroflexota bacterium]